MATAVHSNVTFASARQTLLVAVAGNPNCGKTTIFNALTGLRHKVANYTGVTVEKRDGVMLADASAVAGSIGFSASFTAVPAPGVFALLALAGVLGTRRRLR